VRLRWPIHGFAPAHRERIPVGGCRSAASCGCAGPRRRRRQL